MASVELSNEEWQAVLSFMAYAPARECVPLLNKIGQQLQAQQHQQQLLGAQQRHEQEAFDAARGIKRDANGKEVGHE